MISSCGSPSCATPSPGPSPTSGPRRRGPLARQAGPHAAPKDSTGRGARRAHRVKTDDGELIFDGLLAGPLDRDLPRLSGPGGRPP
jgi:hypothetical protein